jgi:hypothetical protein
MLLIICSWTIDQYFGRQFYPWAQYQKKNTATNMGLAIMGQNYFVSAFVQYSTLVLRMNISAKMPRLRQYPAVSNLFFRLPRFVMGL